MCLLSSSTASSSYSPAESTNSGAVATATVYTGGISPASSEGSSASSSLGTMTVSPIMDEQDEDSGRGSIGHSDSDRETNEKYSAEGSILRRLLAAPHNDISNKPTPSPRDEMELRVVTDNDITPAANSAPHPPATPLLTTVDAISTPMLRKSASVTFCNMRSNILDRRKRRGRKRSQDVRASTESTSNTEEEDMETEAKKIQRNPSPLSCISELEEQLSPKEVEDECCRSRTDEEPEPEEDSKPTSTNSILRSYLESPPINRRGNEATNTAISREARVADDPLGARPDEYSSINTLNDARTAAAETVEDRILGETSAPTPTSNSITKRPPTFSRPAPLFKKLERGEEILDRHRIGFVNPFGCDDTDVEEEVVYTDDDEEDANSVEAAETLKTTTNCSIAVVDLFRDSPLGSLACGGCRRHYSGADAFSFDFKCQTVCVVCSQCSWWSLRRIASKKCSYGQSVTAAPNLL